MSEQDWKQHVKGLVRAEMVKRSVSFADLADLLEEKFGVVDTPANLSNKVGRGTFGAILMVQILEAIGCDNLQLPTV